MQEAVRVARRAVELGPGDAVALCNAGFALTDIALDFDGGDVVVERALALNPNLAWAWQCSSWSKCSLGEPEIALERVARALRLSPQDPQIASMYSAQAMAYLIGGRYEEAVSAAEMAIRLRPNMAFGYCIAAASAAMSGRTDDARRFIARARKIEPKLSLSNASNLMVFRRSDDRNRWAEGLRVAWLPE